MQFSSPTYRKIKGNSEQGNAGWSRFFGLVKHLTLLIGICLMFLGCRKFEDLNTNPNEPTTTNPDFLFTESIISGNREGFSTGVHTEIWDPLCGGR